MPRTDTENAMLPEPTIIQQIRGFLDPEEGRMLYECALEASPRGPCLEIGSYCGKSTAYLGSACLETGGILFAVDHHRGSEEQQPGEAYFDPALLDDAAGTVDTFPAFRRTLTLLDLADTVVPMVCPSLVAARCWTTPISLLFIDGGHAFETVWQDYSAWSGHIMSGGLLLMHDIYEDPADGGQAPFEVFEMALASGLFVEQDRCGSLRMLRRQDIGSHPPPRTYAY
jgi:hypothetical protein